MQIIYISTTGEKYLRFNFQNMKARKSFACCNLAARCLHTKEELGLVATSPNFLLCEEA